MRINTGTLSLCLSVPHLFSFPYDFCATLACTRTTVQFFLSFKYCLMASLVSLFVFSSNFSMGFCCCCCCCVLVKVAEDGVLVCASKKI